jgi:hypothetical protein
MIFLLMCYIHLESNYIILIILACLGEPYVVLWYVEEWMLLEEEETTSDLSLCFSDFYEETSKSWERFVTYAGHVFCLDHL